MRHEAINTVRQSNAFTEGRAGRGPAKARAIAESMAHGSLDALDTSDVDDELEGDEEHDDVSGEAFEYMIDVDTALERATDMEPLFYKGEKLHYHGTWVDKEGREWLGVSALAEDSADSVHYAGYHVDSRECKISSNPTNQFAWAEGMRQIRYADGERIEIEEEVDS